MNTQSAAEKMLESGLFYNEVLLARAFGESAANGARCIKNICNNDRYTVEIKETPIKCIKVTGIDGRRVTIDQLQNTALLFKRPSLLVGGQAHGHR
ncbi:hypothetical protein [Pseudoalteromonas arctica]|uniref:Uncharacterized protein n=1 Tax=Pseudoalteromonas arctica A 37-1-2 TaxID=1117313 RepID=A0A290S210_9GAMM|nr:hypothetical protein [Pseudoalteromonas arctica]ATC86146.1 hypothetical protein PARC_a1535 [Pseudoalteromonas arctica A 37-1-2]